MSAPGAKAKPDTSTPHGRTREFARIALSRKLVTREHAEECLRASNDLAKRGKSLAIEEVFVRKGYLRKADAQAIARLLPAAKKASPGSSGELELAPNVGATPDFSAKGRRCPSCDKDPGRAEDYCPRCGADLETGGPGPDATICTSCGRVVKKGSAVCPRCALPIERSRLGRKGTGGAWVDRLVLLVALTGCFYFLVYRHVIAPGPSTGAVEGGDDKTPAERVRDALAKEDFEAAAKALDEAVKEEGHDPALEPAYAVALLRSGRGEDARGAIFAAREKRPDDTELKLVAAEIAAATNDTDGARRVLALITADADKDDRYQRTRAKVAEVAKDFAEAQRALDALKAPTDADVRRKAEVAVAFGQKLSDEGKPTEAVKELEKAVALQSSWAYVRERFGVVLLKQGNARAAAVQFARALDLDGNDAAACFGLAVALDKKAEGESAREALERYRQFLRMTAAKESDYAAERAAVTTRIAALDKKK